MANKTISPEECRFIREVIRPQLQKEQSARIFVDLKPYEIKYCTISNGDPRSFIDNIILVPGFGSGWPGTMRLAYEIAKLGNQVTAISLLGYGNSDNSPYIPSEHDEFLHEAAVLDQWVFKVFPYANLHWIGHSMSAPIISALASLRHKSVTSLTLLNPACFEEKNMLELALNFGLNGLQHAWAFHNDPIWEELQKFFPKQKGPFTSDRLQQRLSEGRRVCKKIMPDLIKRIEKNIPILCISGEKDTVFPYQEIIQHIGAMKMLPDLYHNTTMFGAEKVAREIHEFVSSIY